MSSRIPDRSNEIECHEPLEPIVISSLEDQVAHFEAVITGEPDSPLESRGYTLSIGRVRGSVLLASKLPQFKAIDCNFAQADCSNAAWVDVRLVRCVFDSCKCTGLDTRGGTLRDIRFSECKMPDVFMQESTLDRVWFESCHLQNLDLSASTLERVTIRDCDARGMRLLGARINALDLRGSRIDQLVIDTASVRHLIIDPMQAPAIAESLGVRVVDQHEEI